MSSAAKGYSLYAKNKYLVEQSSVRIIDSSRRDDPTTSSSADFAITLEGEGMTDVVGIQIQSAMIPNPLTVVNSFNDSFVFSSGFGCRRASTKVKLKLKHKNYTITDLVTTTLGDPNPKNIELNTYNLATRLYTYGIRIVPTLESDGFHGDLNYLTFMSLFPFVIDSKNSTAAKIFGLGDVAKTEFNPTTNPIYDWSKNGLANKVFYKGEVTDSPNITNIANHYLHGSIGLSPITDIRGLYATGESLAVNSVDENMSFTYAEVSPLFKYNEPSSYTYTPPSATDSTVLSGDTVDYYSGTPTITSTTFPSKHQLPWRQLTDSFSSWNSPRIPTHVSGVSKNWYTTFAVSGRNKKRAGGQCMGVLTSIPVRDGAYTISTRKYTTSLPTTDDAMFTLDIAPNTALVKGSYRASDHFTSAAKSDLTYGAAYTDNLTLAHQRHTRLTYQSTVILDGLTIDLDPACDLVQSKWTEANLDGSNPATTLDVVDHGLKWTIHDFTSESKRYHTPAYYYSIEIGTTGLVEVAREAKVWLDEAGYVVRLDETNRFDRTTTSVTQSAIITVTRTMSVGLEPTTLGVDITTFVHTVNGSIEKRMRSYSSSGLVATTTTVVGFAENLHFTEKPLAPIPFTYVPRWSPLKWATYGPKTIGYVDWTGGRAVICERIVKSIDPNHVDHQYSLLRYRTPWKAITVDIGWTTATNTVLTQFSLGCYSSNQRVTESTGISGLKSVVTTGLATPAIYTDIDGRIVRIVPMSLTSTGNAETTSCITDVGAEPLVDIAGIPSEMRYLYCPQLFRSKIDDDECLLKEGVCRVIAHIPTLSSAPDFYTTINGAVANANSKRVFLDLVGVDGVSNAFTDEITNMIGYVDWQFESNRTGTLASHLNACKLYLGEVYSVIHKFEKAANSIRRIRVTITNKTGYKMAYRMADVYTSISQMMNPEHSNNITLSNILVCDAMRTTTTPAPSYTEETSLQGPLYGYPLLEAHFQWYPGTVRTPNLPISANDARAYFYNNTAALTSNDTTVPGDDFNTMVNFINFAGYPTHILQAPNYVNFIPTKRLVLRCPQLESHIDTTTLNSVAPTGVAIFAVTSTAKIYNTMEGISLFIAGNHRFHPISRITKLSFRIENESGQVVDMGGLDYYFSILFYHLVHNRFVINDVPMALASDIDETGENVAHEDDEIDDAFTHHLLERSTDESGKMSNEKIRVVNLVESGLYNQFGESMSTQFAPDSMKELPHLRSVVTGHTTLIPLDSVNTNDNTSIPPSKHFTGPHTLKTVVEGGPPHLG